MGQLLFFDANTVILYFNLPVISCFTRFYDDFRRFFLPEFDAILDQVK